MNCFERIPINLNELMNWKRNKLVNPRTNRKIKYRGGIYNYIKEKYSKQFPNNFDFFDSVDSRDPISLKQFYVVDGSSKIFTYENPNNIIIYRESEEIIRCFEKETIAYLNTYKIKKHPVSQKEIPSHILDQVSEKQIDNNISIEDKALKIFQMFTKISLFIDYKLFLNLNRTKLNRLNYELKEFYYENLSISDRAKIDGKDGKQILKLRESNLDELSENKVKSYLLDQFETLLNYKDEDLKFMINYIILGALSLVIDEVKEIYDNFNFSF